jgi:hypothetical protein
MHHMEIGELEILGSPSDLYRQPPIPVGHPVKGRIRRRGILFAAIETQIISCNHHLEPLLELTASFPRILSGFVTLKIKMADVKLPESMKAQFLDAFNTPYNLRSVSLPKPASKHYLLIKVDAASYCQFVPTFITIPYLNFEN